MNTNNAFGTWMKAASYANGSWRKDVVTTFNNRKTIAFTAWMEVQNSGAGFWLQMRQDGRLVLGTYCDSTSPCWTDGSCKELYTSPSYGTPTQLFEAMLASGRFTKLFRDLVLFIES